MARKSPSARRRYVRFTRWRRAHFFRVLEETGHVQMAAEAAGVSLACIYRLRRVEAGFSGKMAAAVAKADRRLEAQERGQSGDSHVTVTSGGACGQEQGQSGDSHVTVTGCGQQALVIRRGIGGRLRVMAAGRNWWTERHDALFFDHLRATGCVAASARAAGFTPKTAWNRRDRLPGFARAMDEAREDSDLALEFQLCAQAQRKRGDDWGRPPAAVPAEQAIRTLSFRENRRRGKHKPRRAKPPDMEALAGKIERKVKAIKRYRAGKAQGGDSHS